MATRRPPSGTSGEAVLAHAVARVQRELDDLRGTTLARLTARNDVHTIVPTEPITGATNYPIPPGVYSELHVTLRGSMTTTPGWPLVLLNDELTSADYRTSGYLVDHNGNIDDVWADVDFWRPGMVSTAPGVIQMTIFQTHLSGFRKHFMGRGFRDASSTSFRTTHTQGGTNVDADAVDRIRITHRISEFGAIDTMYVTIKGLVA